MPILQKAELSLAQGASRADFGLLLATCGRLLHTGR
jgi:hypothetical protein